MARLVDSSEMRWWLVACGACNFMMSDLPNRNAAIAEGQDHIQAHHADDEEWSFRIQGFKRRTQRPQ